MMQVDYPTLIINKLKVYRLNKVVYEQNFHRGINIIRGENSVGKSTIMNLIFFGLGGDLKKERWTVEAASCSEVQLEISINGYSLTMRRSINVGAHPPILFFDGSLDDSLKTSDGWTEYSYRRSENRFSFSQRLFELLGWGQYQGVDGDALTMHQVLRLVYVDQDTPASRILKIDMPFDKGSLRQAVGDFLLNIDSLESYSAKNELRVREIEFNNIDSQLKTIYKFISPTEGTLQLDSFEAEQNKALSEIKSLIQERESILLRKESSFSLEKVKKSGNSLAKEINSISMEIDNLVSDKSSLLGEIAESKLFLASIVSRKKSLKESKLSYNFFGEVSFKYCPSCLSKLSVDRAGKCNLCKSDIDNEKRDRIYLAALTELEFQEKESKKVLSAFETELLEKEARAKELLHLLNKLKRRHKDILIVPSDKLAELNDISQKIGSLENTFSMLDKKKILVLKVSALVDDKKSIQDKITTLEDKITEIEYILEEKKLNLQKALSKKTISLILKDNGYEDKFDAAESLMFDFTQDIIMLDGQAKFSASSEVVLKNSFHLAILLEAIENKSLRYPRLLLLDNVEDKGMTSERSHNFQHTLIESLSDIKDDYQVIMTTSMINPKYDNSDYCVGPHYRKGSHTLNV